MIFLISLSIFLKYVAFYFQRAASSKMLLTLVLIFCAYLWTLRTSKILAGIDYFLLKKSISFSSLYSLSNRLCFSSYWTCVYYLTFYFEVSSDQEESSSSLRLLISLTASCRGCTSVKLEPCKVGTKVSKSMNIYEKFNYNTIFCRLE